jgi:predicted  nucleic acid-binding Zn-ribbon protein
MANDNKHDQVASVEQRLKSLYELQTILSEIDRIKQIRGELPLEVKDLEDEIAGLNTRIENYSREIEEMQQNLASEREKIKSAEDLISRYKEQLDNVRNNREFDLLTKEVEFQNLEIELCEKHINDFNAAIRNKQSDIKQTENVLEDRNHTLNEKRTELNEIVSETREQEDTLRDNAKALEPKIDERTLTAFKRIRKNARNGLGIVYVERNACGGCFNRIPPQKQAEIKMHKKVIVCEYCGRIMIDPDLAGVTLAAPAPTRTK